VGYVYHNLAKAILLRAGQMVDGVDADALNTTYSGLLADMAGGVEVPLTALRRDILAVEALVAAMIGQSSNAQLRMAIAGEAGVSSGDDVPTSADTGGKFVGKFDGLFNDDDDTSLALMEGHVVDRRIANKGTFYRIDLNGYYIDGTKVFFQCSGGDAYFRGCVWNQTQAETEYDEAGGTGTSVLPYQCELIVQNKVLANIAQENWFTTEAANYNAMADAAARDIGLLPEPAKQDELLATTEENKNA